MYCTNCGKEINETPFCPYCGTKVETKKVCRYCGGETQGTPYCPHCGKSQAGTAHQKTPNPSATKKLALCGAVLLIFLLGIRTLRNLPETSGDEPDEQIRQIHVDETETQAPEPEERIQETADTRAETYAEAVRLYEKRDYNPARDLFESLSGYQDSEKYLRLIRIRFSGGNIGVGSKVYKAEYGLTETQKRDIDAAAADFYFADTAEVLVCNSDVAAYYLIGEWNGGSKCYIHFIANNYGCRYNIGSKLSTNYQDTFGIYEGIVYVDVVEDWAQTLKLTLVSPDCMEVYTYEKGGKTYTLTRY